MKIVSEPKEMQRLAEEWRSRSGVIGFVPTMGYLHEGHLELMRRGRDVCDHLVASIFVNPTQFGPNEDLATYPRNFDRDCELAGSVGVDVIFYPSAEKMYPEGFQTYVEVTGLTAGMEGASRPGHFKGVATVVCKLFHQVKPHYAYFGEKDYQQLAAIRRMVRDLDMDLTIVGCPTVREESGLALSSRNAYLSVEGKKAGLCLSRSLARARELARNGETDAGVILREARAVVEKEPLARLDYMKICHPESLEELEKVESGSRLIMAVRVENTRLLDNGPLL
jgi:pantoate--beta-alanine ligase